MAKFEEANARMFKDIFVCRRCKSKMKVTSMKVSKGKVKCKKCNYGALRPKRKK